jgi:hypothetical protein
MSDCKLCTMSIDTQTKVSINMGSPVNVLTTYRSLVRTLEYLTFTKPDISYMAQQVCLHMHDPYESHLTLRNASSATSRHPQPQSASLPHLYARAYHLH